MTLSLDSARDRPFPLRLRSVQKIVTFEYTMTPDYPHKHFADKRNDYSLLMLTLAMDSAY